MPARDLKRTLVSTRNGLEKSPDFGDAMEATQLAEVWRKTGERMVSFPVEALDGIPMSTTAAAFLRDVGLPASVAPFLDFRPPKSGPLPTVDQLWRLKDGKFGNFYVIGSNGSGDSIAIALSGSVVYLNHDDGFRPCYINKDVLALSETLLRFREMIQEAAKRNGSTFVYGQVPREAVDTMREHLRSYDPTALDEGAMWADELDEIDSERT